MLESLRTSSAQSVAPPNTLDKPFSLERCRSKGMCKFDQPRFAALRIAQSGTANKVKKTVFSRAFGQKPERSEYPVSGTNHATTDRKMKYQPALSPEVTRVRVA